MTKISIIILFSLVFVNSNFAQESEDKEFDDIYETVKAFCQSEYDIKDIVKVGSENLILIPKDTLVLHTPERAKFLMKFVKDGRNPNTIDVLNEPVVLILSYKIINAELKGYKATVKVEYDLAGEIIEVDKQFVPYTFLKLKNRLGEKEIVYLNLEKKKGSWVIREEWSFKVKRQFTRYKWWVIDPPTPHVSAKAAMNQYKFEAERNTEILEMLEGKESERKIQTAQKRNLKSGISIYENLKKLIDGNSRSVEHIWGLFPEATIRELRSEEIGNKTEKELQLMRNEIFARKGYVFKNKDLMEYFLSEGWYEPKYENVDSMLTEIEKENIKKIREEEQRRKQQE